MDANFELAPAGRHLSSLGDRFLALLIDGLIICVLGAFGASLIPVLGGIVVWFFYAPILESSALQATIGKRMMGLQVIDLAGNRLTLRDSFVRNLMKVVSSALCFAGYLFAFFSNRKQTLHDKVAETLVVDGRSVEDIADAWSDGVKALFRFQTSVFQSPVSTDECVPSPDVVSQLERLKAMRDRGELTEDEFQTAKAKVLRS